MAGKIGPHEGREFQLFSEARKDLILFGEDGLPENYRELACHVGAYEYQFFAGPLKGIVLYREGHYQDAVRLGELVQRSMEKPVYLSEIE